MKQPMPPHILHIFHFLQSLYCSVLCGDEACQLWCRDLANFFDFVAVFLQCLDLVAERLQVNSWSKLHDTHMQLRPLTIDMHSHAEHHTTNYIMNMIYY